MDTGRSGRAVHVYVGNEIGRTSCVRVWINDALLVARDVESSEPGLPAYPLRYANTRIDAPNMTVKVAESAGGLERTELVEIPPEVFLVVTVGVNDLRIDVHDREPPPP